MELALKKETLDHYELTACLTSEQEQSTESIVQDTLPDIGRILCCEGEVFLRNSLIREDKAELGGNIELTTIYAAEGSGELRHLKIILPFQMREDCPKGSEKLHAELHLEDVNCRTLNPRKLHCKWRIVAEISCYAHREDSFCSCCCGEEEDIECLQRRENLTLLTDLSERDFTYEDTLSFSSGHGYVKDILHICVNAQVNEAKIVGNKAAIKGVYFTDVFVCYDNGRCETLSYELPFAQLVDSSGDDSEGMAEASVALTGMDYKLLGDESGQTLALSLFTHLELKTLCKREVPVLCDLYSTAFSTETELQELKLLHFAEPMTRRQIWQDSLELGSSMDSILHLCAKASTVKLLRTEEGTEFRTQVHLQILYSTTDGKILSAERTDEVKLLLALAEGETYNCTAKAANDLSAVITGDHIAVRVPVDFTLWRRDAHSLRYIRSARCQTEQPISRENAPSLVLRRRESGESLWSIAKRHNTTMRDILSANGCEAENELICGKMLLIPKRRS